MNIVAFADEELPLEVLDEIMRGSSEQVALADAQIIGGHSIRDKNIKFGLSVTGYVHPQKYMSNHLAQADQILVLTKPLGSGFITSGLRKQAVSKSLLEKGITVMSQLNRLASEVAVKLGVRGSTDITGFGLAGHAIEMAQASCISLVINLEQLPIIDGIEDLIEQKLGSRANLSNQKYAAPLIDNLPENNKKLAIPLALLFDPQTSGGLLLSVAKDKIEEFEQNMKTLAQPFYILGETVFQQSKPLIINF